MEKYLCYGKKNFCDSIDKCRFCKFADGTGCVDGELAHSILYGIFGEDYGIDRLKELVEADREGRCVVLPCKVGDKVYCIQSYFNDAKMRSEKKVKCRIVDFMQSFPDLFECCGMIYRFEDIGKTVFLTQEEAEAALEMMKEGDR